MSQLIQEQETKDIKNVQSPKSNDDFIEKWAISQRQSGEYPAFGNIKKGTYSRRLWDNHYRVSYFDMAKNIVKRTMFCDVLIVEGQQTVHVRPEQNNSPKRSV